MARRLPGEEKDRFRCQVCGFPCKEGRDSQGSYGSSGWDFSEFTDDGDAIVTNGAFTAVTTGWTGIDCILALNASGQSGNCLELTVTGGDEQYAYQALSSLEFNVLYGVTAYVKSGSSGDETYEIQIRTPTRDRVLYRVTGTSSTTWTQSSQLRWHAFQGDNVLCLVKATDTAGTMLFDTVSGYEQIYSVKEEIGGCPSCGSKNWMK